MSDAWESLVSDAVHEINLRWGCALDDSDEPDTEPMDETMVRETAEAILQLGARAALPANDVDEHGDDGEDHEDRDEVGVADGGEQGSPPQGSSSSAPAPAESADAEGWAEHEREIDGLLSRLQLQVACLAVYLPDLPARGVRLIDNVLAAIDDWERSR